MTKEARSFDIVVVGAGAAGLGLGVTLRDLGIENFVILDRSAVGASFLRWPRQTRFITPSFNTNQFGILDLNSICLHTSPAYSVGVEHPTGEEYAGYQLALKGGDVVHCAEQPILASGFAGSAGLVRSLFDWQDDGFPLLTENDESTVTDGLFLVGPQVRQGDIIEAPMLRPPDSPWSGCVATIPSCWLPREPNWTQTWPTCCRS